MNRHTEVDKQSCEERSQILTAIVQREEHERIASGKFEVFRT